MSIRSTLKHSGHRLDDLIGGAHLTREARRRTIKTFCDFADMARLTHLTRFSNVRGKDLKRFVQHRLAQGICKRTLHNELSHLRALLRADGAGGVADSAEQSNAQLGLAGANRRGTNQSATSKQVDAWCAAAESTGRFGISAMLRLCCFLGLRGNEAIHVRLDTLQRWKHELGSEGGINVVSGTKGGRKRFTKIQNMSAAIGAIELAETVIGNGTFLIERADRGPIGGLKQARSIWHSWAHRNGVKPHSLRYAFAHAQFESYVLRGFSEREALASLSQDLGHGDGRGRWVRSVYLSSRG